MDSILKQFYDLKSENPEALLLFRTGDFYETYSEDAEEASKILGITLTKSSIRKDKDGEPLKMAAFPHHGIDTYLPKLIRAGKRIAICEQLKTHILKSSLSYQVEWQRKSITQKSHYMSSMVVVHYRL